MTQPSAVRVFDIPELLEDILLHATCQSTRWQESLGQLYQLQRVSKRFHTTIAGSKPLQRLMFMAPVEPSDSASSLPYHQPVLWFLCDFLSIHLMIDKCTRGPEHRLNLQAMNANAIAAGRESPISESMLRKCTEPAASWRRMTLANVEECAVLSVQFLVYFRSANFDGHIRSFYGVDWKFSGAESMGELFDGYVDVLKRDRQAHLDAARVYWANTADQ